MEFEIKIPFIVAAQYVKYLGISLTKDVQVLHTENCKILLKAIKKI